MTTKPSDLSYDAIREYAERVGEHNDIYDGLGQADVTGLVDRLGGDIKVSDGEEASIVWGGDAAPFFRIYLSPTTSARRDRFTIAHELGHLFLHYLYPKIQGVKTFGRGARNQAETEANVFASSLLMPKDAFTKAYAELNHDLVRVAHRFDVSPDAASVRRQVLRLAR